MRYRPRSQSYIKLRPIVVGGVGAVMSTPGLGGTGEGVTGDGDGDGGTGEDVIGTGETGGATGLGETAAVARFAIKPLLATL